MSRGSLPYWRLSGFYFFYFAVVGTAVPFLGLYLQSHQFSASEIGEIAAIMMVTRVIAPNIWGWLSDVSGQRLRVIRLGALLACVCFSGLFWQQSFFWVALVIVGYSFFWNAVLAQFEVITLAHLEGRPNFYSRVRLWGSIGFIVAVVLLGYLFEVFSIELFPVAMLLFLACIWLSALSVREPKSVLIDHSDGDGFWSKVASLPVICFLLSSFFLQVSHGAYYTFYSVYLEGLSYSRTTIGVLWGLGVIAEVVVFWYMHHLFKRFGARNIMLFTLVVTVIRWWLIGCYSQHMWVLVGAQVLHAFSFGTAHAVAIELVRRFFGGRTQGQGQALYSAVSFGAGGAVGALISGWVWAESSVMAFAISALAAALALALVWWGLRGEQVES